MKSIIYENGLLYDSKMQENLQDMHERIELNKASVICIDGSLGEGKTTLAVELLEGYQGFDIDWKTQYAMGASQFQEKLQICYELGIHAIIYDEAGDFNRRGAMTRLNAILNRIFDTFRTFKIFIIMVLPRFYKLDSSLFESSVLRMVINCHDRSEHQGNYRVYSLDTILYIMGQMSKLSVKQHCYTLATPNFRGHFLNLPTEKANKLNDISTAGKLDLITEGVLRAKGYITLNEIARIINKNRGYVYKKLLDKKIKHVKIYKKVKYFENWVIDKIQE